MTIIANGRRFDAVKYGTEKQFEDEIVEFYKLLFGKATIYIDAKKKIESKTLGATVPDGFFFDFNDPTDPQFYIVEVELSKHGFYNHIFPQITKFFAFYNNTRLQKSLVDKLFTIVDTDSLLKADFKRHLGHTEVYKFLSDIVESSQNILLISDGSILELPEIIGTYTDTWGRMVRFLEIKKYTCGQEVVYSTTPDIETLQYMEAEENTPDEVEEETPYTEEFHLDGVAENIKEIYKQIKESTILKNDKVIFNTQKYYISIKAPTNIAYIKFRKKKIRFVAMMPETRVREIIKLHTVVSLSQPVQDFYGRSCAAVDIPTIDGFDEIKALIQELMVYNTRNA